MCDEKYDIVLVENCKKRYFLIDFENVHHYGLIGIENLTENDELIIFYSLNADSIPFSLFEALHTTPAKLVLNNVDVGEKNALDFQLATYCGYLIGEDNNVEVHIISCDKGYEFIRSFWSKKGIEVILSPNIAGIEKTNSASVPAESPPEMSRSEKWKAMQKEKAELKEQNKTVVTETVKEETQTVAVVINDIDTAIASLNLDKKHTNIIKQIFNDHKKGNVNKRKQAINNDLIKKYGGEKTKIYYKAIKPFIK